ncbi:DEAD/DEAH box helicase family protein [Novipirellula artificiosorum]|uniref:Type-1 restriction enzyme R protein n=1 Tax=Novipirellula artificiosorum TaxID=2528016 RepID=A0A5C6DZ09_9BACT|nr:DEAD/DEAH box helicase family protein [Novipirellula artificiosorum]TWU41878.1 Type-1 restriction enzyme R protein [Novipirellula artificiosorum]
MKSLNFEFLRPKWPELSGLGGFAEAYAHPDPVGAISKLRVFCEQVVEWIHHDQRLPKPPRANLNDLLHNQPFKDVVPEVVLSKLHALRMEGNNAAHGNKGDTTTALRLTREAFNVARWLHVSYASGNVTDCPEYCEPPTGGVEGSNQRREKRAILERVAAQEAQMQKLLADLDNERSRAEQAESTAEERQAALEAALQATSALQSVDPMAFSEEETRKYLIDQMLADEGWDVGKGNTNTAEVVKEAPVKYQVGASGAGKADYLLDDDNGKPLGVVEAKKTAVDPQLGRKQAEQYADGLEKEHGQRPVIFYTNGYDQWIWNDAAGEPPRKIYGFYSKDSLQHLHFQRTAKKPVGEVSANPDIAGRMYQIEAVRRVVEQFAEKKRKALLVQATGTGKTRVAISLCDAMIKANWAKRILFLCDRRELRRQANNAFNEFLPSLPRTYVSGASAGNTKDRIFLSTYPAMMKVYQSFDVGFFDLIIADESHRSLYNRYRTIFEYFDSYQLGLTATPVDFVSRNTFKIFECDEGDPTSNYDYPTAVAQKHLVPFEVDTHTTPFLRSGIKYSKMTPEQRQQLEEDEVLPQAIEFEQGAVDKVVYNKDTNRHILRNLMDHGIRVGSRIGKTIVFARSIKHARLMEELFNEMYPQYGGKFCQTVVSDDPRAESMIDDFKGDGSNPDLTIAISVDMLDTGVDVPECVNLVFAKPVYSYVKFWQMIGRGTRLCLDLFGPDLDKSHFQIFDHWGNFERFEQDYKAAEPVRQKSLCERVFEARMKLAEAALEKQHNAGFQIATGLISKQVADLPTGSIPIKEKWKQVQSVSSDETVRQFDAATKATLQQDVAPLMQWVDIAKHEEAYKFDRLIAQLQAELIRGGGKFSDMRDEVVNLVSSLRINLSQVKLKLSVIERVKSDEFWDEVTVAGLEEIRDQLRGIVQFRRKDETPRFDPVVIDVREDEADVERKKHKVRLDRLDDLDMVAYRNRVNNVLQAIIDQNETLRKIRLGQPVTEHDLEDLCSLVLTQEPGLDLHNLLDYFTQAESLDQAIRAIIGMDADVVQQRFTEFVQAHPNLASHQIKFLDLLQNHIAKFGSIKTDDLYAAPFTTLHSDSLDGLFDESLADELFDIIGSFQPQGREDNA